MKILVTGGGGFIGGNLLVSLPQKYKIISLDLGEKYNRLQPFIGSNISLVKGDIGDEHIIDEVMGECDIVVHLAGGGGNDACMKNPSKAVMSYIYGLHLLLQKALKYKVKHFIFASSERAYSTFKKRKLPLTEDMGLEPDSLYGALKASSEYLIRDSGIDFVILRFSNVYGYGCGINPLQMGGVIGNFIRSAYENKEITIFGSGKQKIDFVNINDVTRVIRLAIEKSSKNSSIKNKIYNIGSGKLTSIENLANIVTNIAKKEYGHKKGIKKIKAPQDKIWPDRLLSIKKIKKELGWKPSISIKEGLKEMMIKYKEVKK